MFWNIYWCSENLLVLHAFFDKRTIKAVVKTDPIFALFDKSIGTKVYSIAAEQGFHTTKRRQFFIRFHKSLRTFSSV